jgi:hypothetical protein
MNDKIPLKFTYHGGKTFEELVKQGKMIPDELVKLCRENLRNKMNTKDVILKEDKKYLPFPRK